MVKSNIPQYIKDAVDGLISPFGYSFADLLAQNNNNHSISEKKWITIVEAEEFSSLSRWTLGRLAKAGKIRQSKLGDSKSAKVLIDKLSLDKFLESKVESPLN